jgi:hypothetical protein
MVTVPFEPESSTAVIVIGSPSTSVSFARTLIGADGSSSVTIAESSTATAGSSAQVTVIDTVAVSPLTV